MKLHQLFVFIALLAFSCNMNYIQFKPVISQDDQFVVSKEVVSSEFHENIVQVFDFYKVDYKIDDSKILIDATSWKDKDLMWNYTNKAKNQDWLNSHPVEKLSN